jgi:predicted aconitase
MYLTPEEEKMSNGEYGETIRKSMDILIALGDIYEAERFVDISSAQVSGVSYKTIGQAGLESTLRIWQLTSQQRQAFRQH